MASRKPDACVTVELLKIPARPRQFRLIRPAANKLEIRDAQIYQNNRSTRRPNYKEGTFAGRGGFDFIFRIGVPTIYPLLPILLILVVLEPHKINNFHD